MTARNLVGLAILVTVVLVATFVWQLRGGDRSAAQPSTSCHELRTADLASSRDRLRADLAADIHRLRSDIAALGGPVPAEQPVESTTPTTPGIVAADGSTGEAASTASAPAPTPPGTTAANTTTASSISKVERVEGLQDELAQELQTDGTLTTEQRQKLEELEELGDELKANETINNDKIQTLSSRLDAKTRTLVALEAEIAAAGTATVDDVAANPGSAIIVDGVDAITLQPDEPVSVIDLGSRRNPTRVVISFRQTAAETQDSPPNRTETGRAPDTSAVDLGLPDKPDFRAEVGPLHRVNGPEIPPDQLLAWATRFGDLVHVSVCVSPTSALNAGSYEGDVFLLDPTLPTTRAAIEIRAQSPLIRWLYLLLILVPLIAIGYVWVIGRNAAGEDALAKVPFLNWIRQNVVLAFALGFAATWAALQVAFTDRSWGSSVLGAAGIVGVALVSAVTAITAAVGRVRGPGIDPEPDRADGPPARGFN